MMRYYAENEYASQLNLLQHLNSPIGALFINCNNKVQQEENNNHDWA